jgi:hypothetical protein
MRKISFLFYQCSYKLMQLLHIYLFLSLSLSIKHAFVYVIPESVYTIMYVFRNLYIQLCMYFAAHTCIMLFLVSKLRLGGKGVNRSSDCPFNFSPHQLFSHFPWVGVIVLFPPGLHSPPPPGGRGTGGRGRSLGQCIKSLAWRLRID